MPVAIIATPNAKLEVMDFPVPVTAAPGAAIVDIALCGICGSDVAAYRSNGPYPPALSGHEWTGTVRLVGEGVSDVNVGDRVVAGVPPACGRCPMCRAGHHQRCEAIMALPFGVDPLTPDHGGYARSLQFPASYLVPIPDELSDSAAAMVEPATVAMHAVRRNPPAPGSTAVVLGAGPVGLFAAQLVKMAGASTVVVVEPRQRRRAVALEVGATRAVEPGDGASQLIRDITGGIGADLVLDCVGNAAAFASAVDLARPGGTVVMVGVSSTPITVEPLTWMIKEITLVATLAHLSHEFPMTIDLMASGQLLVEPLLDHVVGLDELDSVMSELADGKDYIKVLVDPKL